jgi:hypothetical protein
MDNFFPFVQFGFERRHLFIAEHCGCDFPGLNTDFDSDACALRGLEQPDKDRIP